MAIHGIFGARIAQPDKPFHLARFLPFLPQKSIIFVYDATKIVFPLSYINNNTISISFRQKKVNDMYLNGESLSDDKHLRDHIEHDIPVQVYVGDEHRDIGFVSDYSQHFVRINNVLYSRSYYRFVSRPGY